jgi:hypothetical protein
MMERLPSQRATRLNPPTSSFILTNAGFVAWGSPEQDPSCRVPLGLVTVDHPRETV